MNRNKKGVMPEVTREVYKSVKKFDRSQFNQFCIDLYKFGFEDDAEAGMNSVAGVDVEKVLNAIASTKGIGPKKLADIHASIEAAFGGEKHDGT